MLAASFRCFSSSSPSLPAAASVHGLRSVASNQAPGRKLMSTKNVPLAKERSCTDQHVDQVLEYHIQSKHSLSNYARGPRGLDWANQPNPFRHYLRASVVPLEHHPPQPASDLHYPSLFHSFPPPLPLSLRTLSQLFYDSLALSAWKTTGFSTWSLRCNPSSGNLHPTEAYIISPQISSVCDSSFVAHYAPKKHALEIRARISADFFSRTFPEGSFLVGLASIFWRESWKYGERALRYCNHDVGHAIASVAYAAGTLGWDIRLLDGLGFHDLENAMGLHSYPSAEIPSSPVKLTELEFEHPDCLLLVFPSGLKKISIDYVALSSAFDEFSSLKWEGKPNSLSKDHVCWDIIYRTAEAAKKPPTLEDYFSICPFRSSLLLSRSLYKNLTVREVARKRRSAVDMDGKHVMERETFYQIMLHCLPTNTREGERSSGQQLGFPYRVLPWEAQVHLALFVHRISGLSTGLYFLVRNEDHLSRLKQATRSDFEWVAPEECPDNLPLYRLASGDYRRLANQLSCHQDIAGDGCFSLGMIAHFEKTLSECKAWMYPRLFWETGIIGQVLYLEAHAVGISATGIGCYFDDSVHQVLGLSRLEFQSLYHFTVGGPVEDKRIMSMPAYPGPNIDA